MVMKISMEMIGSSTELRVHRLVYTTNSQLSNMLYIDEALAYDTWHSIELRCKIGAGTGAVDLLIDGVSKASQTNISNNYYEVESVMVGSQQSTNYTVDGEYFYTDDITITVF